MRSAGQTEGMIRSISCPSSRRSCILPFRGDENRYGTDRESRTVRDGSLKLHQFKAFMCFTFGGREQVLFYRRGSILTASRDHNAKSKVWGGGALLSQYRV